MAERRMFALKIIDSDAFLDMPASTQSLYFHLSMRADDDGFLSNVKKIMRMIGASEDDLKILLSKRFLLLFDSGIVVIKHWRIHNYIAKDRYNATIYKEEKEALFIKASGAYTDHEPNVDEMYTPCIQNVDTGKVSKGKVSKGKDKEPAKANYSKKEKIIADKPESVSQEVWDEYVSLRKQKRTTVTPLVIKGIEREAKKAEMSLQDALVTCIERGWQGFKADWVKEKFGNNYGAKGFRISSDNAILKEGECNF
jgi:hypothetical protein